MAKVIVIGALPESLLNFRGNLIKDFVAAGHDVIAMADFADGSVISEVEALGARFRSFPVQRNGMNPLRDTATFQALCNAFSELRPDVVLSYTIKPVVWGGLALRGFPQTRFYALVTGLGFAFQGGGIVRGALTQLVTWLYRTSLRRASRVIFQNTDNQNEFISRRIVQPGSCAVVNGSGVDLFRFVASPPPSGEIVFLLIARLLGEKGLREYAQAARMVKVRFPTAVFRLVGPPDPSLDGIPLSIVREWQDQGFIDFLGEVKDVRPHLMDCHVYVLPSYHEGMPRTVLEAMAVGRPILTTDVPGCRETVNSGENGFLVPKADAEALAERMIWFIEHRGELERMGQKSRQMAEERFDVHKVNRQLIQIMGLEPS